MSRVDQVRLMVDDEYNKYNSVPKNHTMNSLARKIQAGKSLCHTVSRVLANVPSGNGSWDLISHLNTMYDKVQDELLMNRDLLRAVEAEDQQYLRPIGEDQKFMVPLASIDDQSYLVDYDGIGNSRDEILSMISEASNMNDKDLSSLVYTVANDIVAEVKYVASNMSDYSKTASTSVSGEDGTYISEGDTVAIQGWNADWSDSSLGVVLEVMPNLENNSGTMWVNCADGIEREFDASQLRKVSKVERRALLDDDFVTAPVLPFEMTIPLMDDYEEDESEDDDESKTE